MEGALEIQKRMMDRLSSKYGFCDPEVMFQKLERELKMYDIESSGLLDYDGFFAAVTRLNVVAKQKDIETLFSIFDENGLGYVNHELFAQCVVGLMTLGPLDIEASRTRAKLVEKLVKHGGLHWLYDFKVALLRAVNEDVSANCNHVTVQLQDILVALRSCDVIVNSDPSRQDVSHWYQCLISDDPQNPDVHFEPTVMEVISVLRSGHRYMVLERSQRVREIYDAIYEHVLQSNADVLAQVQRDEHRQQLDNALRYTIANSTELHRWQPHATAVQKVRKRHSTGIPLDVFLDYCNMGAHPWVEQGIVTEDQASSIMVNLFECMGPSVSPHEALVTWDSFFAYHKSISAAISDDSEFDSFVRMLWKTPMVSCHNRIPLDTVQPVLSPHKTFSAPLDVHRRSQSLHNPPGKPTPTKKTSSTSKYYCRRVAVVHSDGRREFIDYTWDGTESNGIMVLPTKAEIYQQLRKNGVKDISDIIM